jgi:hypothetical protein
MGHTIEVIDKDGVKHLIPLDKIDHIFSYINNDNEEFVCIITYKSSIYLHMSYEQFKEELNDYYGLSVCYINKQHTEKMKSIIP